MTNAFKTQKEIRDHVKIVLSRALKQGSGFSLDQEKWILYGAELAADFINQSDIEPKKTVDLYKWAVRAKINWENTGLYYESEEKVRQALPSYREFRRLDYTKLTVEV